MSRLPDDTDKVIQFNFTNDKNFKKPHLFHFNHFRDQENRLINEIGVLIKEDINLENILIIAFDQRSCLHLSDLIKQTINISTNIMDIIPDSESEAVKLCTIEQSHGLKYPYVFIVGLENLFDNDQEFAEKTTMIDAKNYRQAIYIENTRKINMAMTTATAHLTLFLTADTIPEDLISPHIKTPTIDNQSIAKIHQFKRNAIN